MSNFKMIEKLGLKIWDYKEPHHHFAVDAEELETLLQSAQVVYGYPEDPFFTGWKSMDNFPNKNPTHQALVINVEPIKKQTKAEAALELLERLESMNGIFNVAWVKDDMKRILEMKDEV